MKITKGTIKPFLSKLSSKLFTINKSNKGILRGLIIGATILYMADSSYLIVQNDYNEKDFIEITVIGESIKKSLSKKENMSDKKIINQIIKKQVDEHTPLELLSKYSTKVLQQYMLDTIGDKEKKEITDLLNMEIENDIYKIDSLPKEIYSEITKAAILYHISFKTKDRMFKEEKSLIKKILYTEALLASVAKLETGSFKFDHREFSNTGAYGRFQIIATTTSNIILKLILEEGFSIQNKEKNINSTVYDMLRNYTASINKEYADEYSKKWKVHTETKQINKYLKYSRILNYNYIKELEKGGNLAHLKTSDGVSANDLKEKLFFNKGKLSKYKQFKFSLKVLDFLKYPENQGVLSCFVLEEIYKRNLIKHPELSIEEILYITLKKYNNDKTKKIKNGSVKEIREIYANEGIEYYRDFIASINSEELKVNENKLFKKGIVEKNKKVDINKLFASI